MDGGDERELDAGNRKLDGDPRSSPDDELGGPIPADELDWFSKILLKKPAVHPTRKPLKSSYKTPLTAPIMQGFVIPPDLSGIDDDFLVDECKQRGLIDPGHRVDYIQCPKCRKVIQSRQARYACWRNHLPPNNTNERYTWGQRLKKDQKKRAKQRMEAAVELGHLRKERKEWERAKQELDAARQRLEEERKHLEETRRLARGRRVFSVLKKPTE